MMYLSEEIDEEYEELRASKMAQHAAVEAEYQYIFEEITDTDPSELPISTNTTNTTDGISTNRSGTVRQTKSVNTIATQTDIFFVSQPHVRKVKVCMNEIKCVLSDMSVAAKISLEKARIAAKTFAKIFYGHKYYLSFKDKYSAQTSKNRDRKLPKRTVLIQKYILTIKLSQITNMIKLYKRSVMWH